MDKIILILVLINISCSGVDKKKSYLGTKVLNDSLFVEKYSNNDGGVYASSFIYYYLTDSLNFREFIGSVDDDQGLRFGEYLGGVYFNKYRDRKRTNLIDSSFYDVSLLKSENIFE